MAETRFYYPHRQLIDVTEFLSKSSDSYLMCVSGSMLYALRKFVKERMFWKSTFVLSYEADRYTLPDDTQWDVIQEIAAEWIADSEVVEMCNNRLIDAIEGIAASIVQTSCCVGAGAGGQMVGEDYYWGTATPLDEPTIFGPGEEFETEAAYQSHKCEAANGIVRAMLLTLESWSFLSLAGLTLGTAALGIFGGGLLLNPPIALLFALLATGFLIATFYALSNAVANNYEDLVCALYASTGAIDAYDRLRNSVNDLALDLGVAEISIAPLLDLVMATAPIDTMNSLFGAVGLPYVPGDDVDCDVACADPCQAVYCYWGTYDPGTKIATSASESGTRQACYINFNFDSSVPEWCGPLLHGVRWIETSPPVPTYSGIAHRVRDQGGNTHYSSDNPPASPINNVGQYWGLGQLSPVFSIQFVEGV